MRGFLAVFEVVRQDVVTDTFYGIKRTFLSYEKGGNVR